MTGKTSLYGQINYRLNQDNTLHIKPYIVSFSNMREKNANKLYRDILKTICKDKQLEENVKSVIPAEVQEELKGIEGVESVHNVYFAEIGITISENAQRNLVQFVEENPQYFSDSYGENMLTMVKERR